jgi:hypothetical protein
VSGAAQTLSILTLRQAVGRYIVAVTRRASGGTTADEVQAAYEAMYDVAALPEGRVPDPVLFDQLEAAAYQCWEVLKGQGIVPDEPLDPTLAMNMRDAMYRGPFGHGSTQDVPRFEETPR